MLCDVAVQLIRPAEYLPDSDGYLPVRCCWAGTKDQIEGEEARAGWTFLGWLALLNLEFKTNFSIPLFQRYFHWESKQLMVWDWLFWSGQYQDTM